MGFNKCKNLGHCGEELCIPEFCHKYDPIIPTNADRIRAMSDEELEDGIRKIAIGYEPWCDPHCNMNGDYNCNSCLAKWIKQPAEEDHPA